MLLFDTTPQPKRGRVAAPESPAPEPYRPIYKEASARVGTYDDVPCIDSACCGSADDILDEVNGQWLLECCYCGTGQWIKAIKGYLKPKQEEFRFRDGRFAGLSIAEASREPRGSDYLKWAAESHPRPMVREAVKTWIASNPAGL